MMGTSQQAQVRPASQETALQLSIGKGNGSWLRNSIVFWMAITSFGLIDGFQVTRGPLVEDCICFCHHLSLSISTSGRLSQHQVVGYESDLPICCHTWLLSN